MSITISTVLPKNNDDLRQLLQSARTIELTRENMLLDEVIRVLQVAGETVEKLKVSSLSLLKGGEHGVVFPDNIPFLDALETLKLTVTFQPGCFKQMEIVVHSLLARARWLRRLDLSLYEHRTGAFLGELIEGCPDSFLRPLPLMETQQEKDLKKATALMIDGLMALNGRAPLPRIENGYSKACSMIDDFLDQPLSAFVESSAVPLSASVESSAVPLNASVESSAMPLNASVESSAVPLNASVESSVVIKDSLSMLITGEKTPLHFMSQEQYGCVADAFFGSPLPESLQHLNLKAVLQGSTIQSGFLFLPGLQTLDLTFCQMNDAAFEILAPVISRRLPALRKLVLDRNSLQDAALGELIGPELEELQLQHNPLTNKAAKHLFDCMEYNITLHLVDLSYTAVKGDGLVLLRGLRRWWAKPARLVLPAGCFEEEELVKVSMMVFEGVEIEMDAWPAFSVLLGN